MTLTWYALRSKPRMEEFLCDQVRNRGMEAFSPCIKVKAVNPRARKFKPYFPGYIFVRTNLELTKHVSFQYLPGSAGMVQFGGEAAFIPDVLIYAIQRKVDDINAYGRERFELLKKGERVCIDSGPFTGYDAIFDSRLSGSDRVRVLIGLLKNRHMRVELPTFQVRKKK